MMKRKIHLSVPYAVRRRQTDVAGFRSTELRIIRLLFSF